MTFTNFTRVYDNDACHRLGTDSVHNLQNQLQTSSQKLVDTVQVHIYAR